MREKADYAIFNLLPVKEIEYLPGENFYRHWTARANDAKPVLIYPPLGNAWVVVEWVAKKLGILTLTQLIQSIEGGDSLKPLPITNQTKELGVRYSPEDICFPFKAILGYLFLTAKIFEELRGRSAKKFYPLFLSHESTGVCRERVYGRLEEAELTIFYQREFGKQDFDFYIVKESLAGLLEFITLLKRFSGKNFLETVNIVNLSIKRLDIVERFEEEVRYVQSLGADFFAAEDILRKMKEAIAQDKNSPHRALQEAQKKLRALHKPMLKPKGVIAVTGEIFQIEEAESCSGDALRPLAKMGFYFQKRVGIGHYTPRFQLTPSRFAKFLLAQLAGPRHNRMKELARKGGLNHDAGGHSLDTVGLIQEIQEAKARGEPTYLGVIELLPFNCLPQIVAANVAVSLKKGIPYLRLGCDEHMGNVGVLTRLEAFLDMLEMTKKIVK